MNMKKASQTKNEIFYNFILFNSFFYIKNVERYVEAIKRFTKFILYIESRF